MINGKEKRKKKNQGHQDILGGSSREEDVDNHANALLHTHQDDLPNTLHQKKDLENKSHQGKKKLTPKVVVEVEADV